MNLFYAQRNKGADEVRKKETPKIFKETPESALNASRRLRAYQIQIGSFEEEQCIKNSKKRVSSLWVSPQKDQ